jgi:GTP1/Obg family GTP-binding protein
MRRLLRDLDIMVNNLEIMRDAIEGEEALVSFYSDTTAYLVNVERLKKSVAQELASRKIGG